MHHDFRVPPDDVMNFLTRIITGSQVRIIRGNRETLDPDFKHPQARSHESGKMFIMIACCQGQGDYPFGCPPENSKKHAQSVKIVFSHEFGHAVNVVDAPGF